MIRWRGNKYAWIGQGALTVFNGPPEVGEVMAAHQLLYPLPSRIPQRWRDIVGSPRPSDKSGGEVERFSARVAVDTWRLLPTLKGSTGSVGIRGLGLGSFRTSGVK